MLRFLFVFALAFLLGCVEFERDNPLDPGSPQYQKETSSSSGSQERSSVSQGQSSSSQAPRDVPSSNSAVPSSGSQGQSSVSQGQSSGSQERSSVSQGQSSVSQGQSSGSQEQSSVSQGQSSVSQGQSSVSQGQNSSSSAPSSGSLVLSSSSLAPSSSSPSPSSGSLSSSSSPSAIPDPIATGEITFKGFDFSGGGSYYYIGTNVTIEDNISSTVAVSNAAAAGCGDVKIELSGCGAPGAVTTANANCAITAKAVVTCVQKHELKTATATVVPNPSLNGSCTWEGGNALVGGTTASVTAEPALQNEYGRDCDAPYFFVDGERKSTVYAGLEVGEFGSVSTMSGITIGTTCAGKAVTAITCPNIEVIGILNDSRDNNKQYRIVKIGNQTWMAENLNYNTTGSKCYGDNSGNDSQNRCGTYGRLYNWATAMGLAASCNSSSCSSQIQLPRQGICPSGWHIPSDTEWSTLESAVGGSSTAGTKLKAKSGWNSNGNGTDDFGFSALPGGYGISSGSFGNVGNYGRWWSATEDDASYAYGRYMYYSSAYVYRYNNLKSYLYSVRCVQD